MYKLLGVRQDIYDHFHASKTCQKYFFSPSKEKVFSAYYTSMYLLQDTGESLLTHRENNFSQNPHMAYIEFWGVMQAVVIQQDCIAELYKIIINKKLKNSAETKWSEIRNFRNLCVGHPVCKDKWHPPKRSFMGRGFGDYSFIRYEQFDEATMTTSHPKVCLEKLMGDYEDEATNYLQIILEQMLTKWPKL